MVEICEYMETILLESVKQAPRAVRPSISTAGLRSHPHAGHP